MKLVQPLTPKTLTNKTESEKSSTRMEQFHEIRFVDTHCTQRSTQNEFTSIHVQCTYCIYMYVNLWFGRHCHTTNFIMTNSSERHTAFYKQDDRWGVRYARSQNTVNINTYIHNDNNHTSYVRTAKLRTPLSFHRIRQPFHCTFCLNNLLRINAFCKCLSLFVGIASAYSDPAHPSHTSLMERKLVLCLHRHTHIHKTAKWNV